MKRIMLWANFTGNGVLLSCPMFVDDGRLTADVPEDMELVSITPASGVWMDDDGSIFNTVEDPDSKKARTDRQAERHEGHAKENAAKEVRKAQVLALAASGMDPRAIAEKVGTTTWVVNLWIRLNKAREFVR